MGGDGDEIEAIRAVEQAFGIMLDKADAAGWTTAADVFVSLLAAIPVDQRYDQSLWPRFVTALCSETGVDPATIGPSSRLLV